VEKQTINKIVPAAIDTEKNRGTQATVYHFDKEGKVIRVSRGVKREWYKDE